MAFKQHRLFDSFVACRLQHPSAFIAPAARQPTFLCCLEGWVEGCLLVVWWASTDINLIGHEYFYKHERT